MGKLKAFESKREDRQKIKEKYPKILKIRKFHKTSREEKLSIRQIKERNVKLLTPFAQNVRIVLITLQNVKAKSFFQ